MNRHYPAGNRRFKLFQHPRVHNDQPRRDGLPALDTGALRDHALEDPRLEAWIEEGSIPEGGPHGLEDILPAPLRLPGRSPRTAGDLTAHDVAGVFLATTCRTLWGAAGRRVP